MISKETALRRAEERAKSGVEEFSKIIDSALERYHKGGYVEVEIPNGVSEDVVAATIDAYQHFGWTVTKGSVLKGDQRDTYRQPSLKFS